MSRLIFTVLLVAVSAATASPDPKLETQFKRLYDEYNQAIRMMNSARFTSFLGASFSMMGPDGKVHDRAEMMHYQKINSETTKKVNSYDATIQAITPLANGDVAVIVLQQYDRDQAPTEAPNQPHKIKTSVVQRETWHNELGGWKIEKIEEILTGPVIIDGKMVAQ